MTSLTMYMKRFCCNNKKPLISIPVINVQVVIGERQVEYNAENRPVRWTQGERVVTMGFDRLGRRVFYKKIKGSRVCEEGAMILFDVDFGAFGKFV